MKSVWSARRRLALLGMATALGIAGCAGFAPRAERWTAPPAGSNWEVAQRSTGSYGKDILLRVTRAEAVWQGKPVLTFVNSLGMTTVLAPSGHWVAITGRDGQTITSWDPPLGFDYPMTVGKSWTTPYRMTLGNGKTVPYDLSCRIEAHEKVTVPAGTFDAFKVACTTNIGNDETYWINPDMGVFIKTQLRRTDKSPFGPGTQEAELVTAPTYKR